MKICSGFLIIRLCLICSLFPQLSINKMDPMSQVFCLRWNNHRNNLLTVFDHLLETEAFCDVTLACEDASIKCHKMILSASSTYFQTLFMENSCDHPIVFLKDIKYAEIKTILDYMYKGEVNVAQEELPGIYNNNIVHIMTMFPSDLFFMVIYRRASQGRRASKGQGLSRGRAREVAQCQGGPRWAWGQR